MPPTTRKMHKANTIRLTNDVVTSVDFLHLIFLNLADKNGNFYLCEKDVFSLSQTCKSLSTLPGVSMNDPLKLRIRCMIGNYQNYYNDWLLEQIAIKNHTLAISRMLRDHLVADAPAPYIHLLSALNKIFQNEIDADEEETEAIARVHELRMTKIPK